VKLFYFSFGRVLKFFSFDDEHSDHCAPSFVFSILFYPVLQKLIVIKELFCWSLGNFQRISVEVTAMSTAKLYRYFLVNCVHRSGRTVVSSNTVVSYVLLPVLFCGWRHVYTHSGPYGAHSEPYGASNLFGIALISTTFCQRIITFEELIVGCTSAVCACVVRRLREVATFMLNLWWLNNKHTHSCPVIRLYKRKQWFSQKWSITSHSCLAIVECF